MSRPSSAPGSTARDAVRVGGSALLAGWGAALLLRPAEAARAVAPGSHPPLAAVRVLGARRLVQHLAVAALPSRRVALAAAGVDALHAASMLAVALRPRYRRAALTSAAGAAAAALLTATTAPPAV